MSLPVAFEKGRLEFSKYSVPIGMRAKPFAVSAADVLEVRTGRAPPELVLRNSEVLFVDAVSRPALVDFSRYHGIEDSARADVWELLSEPFLDTQFEPEAEARTLELLAAEGISREQAEAIRRQIGPRMLRYNALHWEWVSFSHADVLWAFGLGNAAFNRLLYRRRKTFYDWCNQIAAAGLGGAPAA